MKKEYSEEEQHIDACLRVGGYNIPLDIIALILAYKNSVGDLGGEMTINDILSIKKEHIQDES